MVEPQVAAQWGYTPVKMLPVEVSEESVTLFQSFPWPVNVLFSGVTEARWTG